MSDYRINEQVWVKIDGRTVKGKVITKPPKGNTHTILASDGRAYDVELPVKQQKAPA